MAYRAHRGKYLIFVPSPPSKVTLREHTGTEVNRRNQHGVQKYIDKRQPLLLLYVRRKFDTRNSPFFNPTRKKLTRQEIVLELGRTLRFEYWDQIRFSL